MSNFKARVSGAVVSNITKHLDKNSLLSISFTD